MRVLVEALALGFTKLKGLGGVLTCTQVFRAAGSGLAALLASMIRTQPG